MGLLAYYIILPLLYLVSLLPFPIMYLVSDFFYLILYKIVGYRKHVVFENLKKSFPDKTHDELKLIEKKFYRFLCDLFLETIKVLTISKKQMIAHCTLTDNTKKIFNDLNEQKRSCVVVLGHYANWEWACNGYSCVVPMQLYGLYHPLSNKGFDGLMYKLRTRFGTKLYAMNDVLREMIKNRNEVSATGFIADQTPPPEGAYWMTFLNQDTPVFVGTEKIAKKFNYPVVFISIKRVKRGYYVLDGEILSLEPKNTADGEITELHTKRLEKDIIANPELWLWSHRRWKHKRKKESQE